MRARNIKPSFFLNYNLARLEPLARLLFVALWCQADRDGRLEDCPPKIKAQGLPYDDCDIEALLAQLHNGGFIRRYISSAGPAIQVLTFRKHQHPHIKEPQSTIPAPDQHQLSMVQAPDQPGIKTSSSLIPHPSSPLLDSAASTVQAPDQHQLSTRLSGSGSLSGDEDITDREGPVPTLLMAEWQVPQSEQLRAEGQGWGEWIDLEAQTEAFMEYYTEGDGRATKHMSWPLTWRSWMRKNVETAQKKGQRRVIDDGRLKIKANGAHKPGDERAQGAKDTGGQRSSRQALRAALEKGTSQAG